MNHIADHILVEGIFYDKYLPNLFSILKFLIIHQVLKQLMSLFLDFFFAIHINLYYFLTIQFNHMLNLN